jgi:hypothetical protein
VRTAGFIYGALEHHLDHLAPFCSMMGIPLIVTEEELLLQAQLHYPDLTIIFWNCLDAPFETVKMFDAIFCTVARPLIDEIFFIAEKTLRKKIKTFWLPHGNSDKGRLSKSMQPLQNEETVLVYGPKMLDYLKEENITPRSAIEVGNYRRQYYRQHQPFYHSLVESLNLPAKTTLLYAPTWQDSENSSSFFHAAESVIRQLPDDYFLLIKLHPNLESNARALQLQLQHESNPGVRFLKRFTPIYPLLEKTDIYLGDASSIGYDFLSFNRPMFFFKPSQFLHQCGDTLEIDNIYGTIKKAGAQSHLSKLRKQIYDYTFGEETPWQLIRQKIGV